ADGQHDLSKIPELISLSEQHPTALISGHPVYDDSVPMGRFIARYITHFWVWIETLSFKIKDSMCGFRVYPVSACCRLMDTTYIGRFMDFDTEIMVKLYWADTPVIMTPTDVVYPEENTSNFRVWKDNWLITKMHTRLVFGMLIRAPLLIWRKFKRS
ncbi:MAG: glycosyltransferase family 2 protein, partial [Gammaproteobacteria bacterium]|nr:glycosyltransferase family 2 protein [Gammaproteobacteria bacterium]